MPLTVDSVGTDAWWSGGGGGTSAIYGPGSTQLNNATGITTTAAATVIYVLISWQTGLTGVAISAPSVKWDTAGANQSFVLVPNADSGLITCSNVKMQSQIWELKNPSTFGNKNITLSWTNTNFPYIEAIAFAGSDTSNPSHNGTNANSPTTSAPSIAVTSATGEIAIGNCSFDFQTYTSSSGTNIYNDTAGQFGGSAANRDVGAATVTLTLTLGAGGGGWAYAACSVRPPAGAAAPTFGWQSRREDERPRRIDLNPDEARQFFRPSQIPVPTQWLPTAGGNDTDRQPPVRRFPDEPPGPWFVRSPNPVPTQWWGTLDDSHPPPIKRSPDEPPAGFFRPSQVPVPTRWLPTAGEHDHIKPIARAPDEPPGPWFVRSPNPVPTSWLPTTGAEDRPPAIKRAPDEPPTFFQPPTAAAVGISGMAWWRPVEVLVGPPLPQMDYMVSWNPRVIVTVSLNVITSIHMGSMIRVPTLQQI